MEDPRVMLRQALVLAGISQAALARATGLTTKHVSQLATGKVPFSVDVALRMESVLPTLSAEELMVSQARAQVRAARMARFNQGTERDPTRYTG
ncbi:MAG: helix-turn-helix transcriptional regulator [Arthrobacter sp.]